jgi:hypothetical protein
MRKRCCNTSGRPPTLRRWGKLGIESDIIGWVIIAIVILSIALVGFMHWRNAGLGAIDYVKNLLRLRG